jgi:peptidoglycan-N-acetylglucosamine deacetylase
MFRYTIPQLVQLMGKSCTWKVKTNDKKLYFTFDDGPHPDITAWVLDELAKYQAKASFFCVGDNVSKYPETYKRILDEGHAVGNHTFNHINGWKHNHKSYFENIDLCAKYIDSSLFRPPFGKLSLTQLNHIKKTYQIIMWDKLSRDFDPKLDINESLDAMKKNVITGHIFVFHDSEKAEKNVKILLPQLLKHFSELGYTFDSLGKK